MTTPRDQNDCTSSIDIREFIEVQEHPANLGEAALGQQALAGG
jgi:hypothetical protein